MIEDTSDYRIVYHNCKYSGDYYTIHLVHYNSKGNISSIGESTIPCADTVDELFIKIGKMLWSDNKKIIDYTTKKEID
jgi:hypothetical protein